MFSPDVHLRNSRPGGPPALFVFFDFKQNWRVCWFVTKNTHHSLTTIYKMIQDGSCMVQGPCGDLDHRKNHGFKTGGTASDKRMRDDIHLRPYLILACRCMSRTILRHWWWSWNILIIYKWDSLPNSFWFIRRESRQLKNVQYAIQVSDPSDTEIMLILTGFNAPERESRTSECFLFPTCDGQVEAEGWESPTAWVLKALGGTNHGVWTLHVFGPCRSATLLTHDGWFLPDLQGRIRKCTRAYWFLSNCLSPGWLSSQYMISIDIMNIVHWPFTCKQMLEPRPTPLAWKMLMRFGPPGNGRPESAPGGAGDGETQFRHLPYAKPEALQKFRGKGEGQQLERWETNIPDADGCLKKHSFGEMCHSTLRLNVAVIPPPCSFMARSKDQVMKTNIL